MELKQKATQILRIDPTTMNMNNRKLRMQHRLRKALSKPKAIITRSLHSRSQSSSDAEEDVTTNASLVPVELKISLSGEHYLCPLSPLSQPSMEEHKSSSSCEEVDGDTGYKFFLDFLECSSGTSPQSFIEGQGDAITANPKNNEIASCVRDFVDKFDQSSNEEEEVTLTISLSMPNLAELDESGTSSQDVDNADEEVTLSISLSKTNLAELDKTGTLCCVENDASGQDVDTVLAWCALSAVLGCKAPSSVTRSTSNKTKQKDNLWGMDQTCCDEMPDLLEESFTSEDTPVLNETSLEKSDDGEDGFLKVPDVEDAQDYLIYEEFAKKMNIKESADSTLTRSALALLLGVPAPSSDTKEAKKVDTNEEDDASNDMGPILF